MTTTAREHSAPNGDDHDAIDIEEQHSVGFLHEHPTLRRVGATVLAVLGAGAISAGAIKLFGGHNSDSSAVGTADPTDDATASTANTAPTTSNPTPEASYKINITPGRLERTNMAIKYFDADVISADNLGDAVQAVLDNQIVAEETGDTNAYAAAFQLQSDSTLDKPDFGAANMWVSQSQETGTLARANALAAPQLPARFFDVNYIDTANFNTPDGSVTVTATITDHKVIVREGVVPGSTTTVASAENPTGGIQLTEVTEDVTLHLVKTTIDTPDGKKTVWVANSMGEPQHAQQASDTMKGNGPLYSKPAA